MNSFFNLMIDLSASESNLNLAAVWNPFSDFKFKPEFTAGNVIQSIAALIATGILASALQKRNLNNRKEKDILIEDAQISIGLIDKLSELEASSSIVEIASLLKQIQVSISNLRSSLTTLKYPNKSIKLIPTEPEIKEIRKLATETPIFAIEAHANSKKCSASVRAGIITLTEERRAKLQDALQSARRKLQSLRLELNRK